MGEEIVLVTGAAGFIGSHVVRELLANGKKVRATVRDPVNAKFLLDLPSSENLEIVKMDLLDRASVSSAVVGCEDVIHCAAALYAGAMDPQRDVIDPSIDGTRNLLSALEREGAVKRIVHTSSVAAVRRTGYRNGLTFTNEDWCDDATVKTNAYGLAKAGAEKMAREWVNSQEEGLRPRYVSINPCIVLGPIMSERHLKGSMSVLDHLLKRKPPVLLKMHVNIVDVRDVAIAHVNALDKGENLGRYIVFNDSMWMKEIAALLRQKVPQRKWPKLVAPKLVAYGISIFHPLISPKWVKTNIGTTCEYDSSPAVDQLGMNWMSLEDTIVDGVNSVVDAGWR
ncbi:MAG: NAD-dependent epimerase/dehydratase family protein [Candidatus Thalassarchaeaceae archaeon]|nr:NAD-dependent epimerase/dehydratase family protein [Candidatus Thalassarchaeaceae archaeon]